MRDIVFIPIRLIKEAEQDNWLRSASYFVRLKSLHKNNTHYNFSLRSLAEKIKCSPACLAHHLKVLESKGLLRYHANNITFLGLYKMQEKFGSKAIGVPVNFKNQNDLLRSQIIRFNLTSQEHSIKKAGIQKRNKGFVPLTRIEKFSSSYVGLSSKGIGKLLGLSAGSGSRIRSKLERLQIFSVNRVYSVLYEKISLADFKNLRNSFIIPAYSFYREGRVLIERRPCMKYLLAS